MFAEKIDQLTAILEKQELDAPNGIVSPLLYIELFAAYLYKGELSDARFLWKRIPNTVKQGNAELDKIWSIYNFLWNNDVTGFFKAMNYEWSNNVAELMFELKEKVYQDTVNLVGLAYSSIFEDCLCTMINQTPEAVVELCKNLGWELQDGPFPRLVIPKRLAPRETGVDSSENQLATLTDFVSFLEI